MGRLYDLFQVSKIFENAAGFLKQWDSRLRFSCFFDFNEIVENMEPDFVCLMSM